jgi:protein TonB
MNGSTAAVIGMPGNAPPTSLDTRPDNLATMLFVAALLHGVLILGITFTAGNANHSSADSASMEVILLTREYEQRPDSDAAAYLAKQNLTGTGTTTEDEALRVAYGRDSDMVMPGPDRDGGNTRPRQQAQQNSADQILSARTPDSAGLATRKGERTVNDTPLRTGMPGATNSVEILATPDTETVMKGAEPRQLLISANTRESRIAAYLDGWTRRVERVGTINFPFELLDQPGTRDPVLEVRIASSGKLSEVIILRSSGNRELDMAAVNILKMAAPFDKFPEYLRNDYDSLKFSYEWQFGGSNVGRMTVP